MLYLVSVVRVRSLYLRQASSNNYRNSSGTLAFEGTNLPPFGDRNPRLSHSASGLTSENSTASSESLKCPWQEFPCQYCDKRFVALQVLKQHEWIHTGSWYLVGEKTFCCEICQREFARRHDMLRHTKTVHKDIMTECSKCSALFERTDGGKQNCRNCEASPRNKRLKRAAEPVKVKRFSHSTLLSKHVTAQHSHESILYYQPSKLSKQQSLIQRIDTKQDRSQQNDSANSAVYDLQRFLEPLKDEGLKALLEPIDTDKTQPKTTAENYTFELLNSQSSNQSGYPANHSWQL